MKKKILYIAAMIICLSIITGNTLAYYVTSATARNVITTGNVTGTVQIVEQRMVNGALQAYPNQPIRIMPSTTVSKIVSVSSTGQPVWVRMNYELTVYDADGKKKEIPADELARVIRIDPDDTNWTRKDGWWYLNSAIKSGETSKPLFESITFSGPDMDNKYQNCTVTVTVNAQAVQKANNGNSVMEALGWPAN